MGILDRSSENSRIEVLIVLIAPCFCAFVNLYQPRKLFCFLNMNSMLYQILWEMSTVLVTEFWTKCYGTTGEMKSFVAYLYSIAFVQYLLQFWYFSVCNVVPVLLNRSHLLWPMVHVNGKKIIVCCSVIVHVSEKRDNSENVF